MLKSIISITIIALLITSCNVQEEKHTQKDQNTGSMSEEQDSHMKHTQNKMKNKQKEKSDNVSNSSIITPIIDNYLELKNSLAQDNSRTAAKAGKLLYDSFKKLDKSKIEESKLKEYNEIEEDAMEHAEHINENADNIAHQREHLALLSTDIIDLIKLIGADRKLFIDECPMYNDGKGGTWISEIKEIKNPYYGNSMLNCGSIKSTIE